MSKTLETMRKQARAESRLEEIATTAVIAVVEKTLNLDSLIDNPSAHLKQVASRVVQKMIPLTKQAAEVGAEIAEEWDG